MRTGRLSIFLLACAAVVGSLGCKSSEEGAKQSSGSENVLKEYVATPLERSKDVADRVSVRDETLEDSIDDIDSEDSYDEDE